MLFSVSWQEYVVVGDGEPNTNDISCIRKREGWRVNMCYRKHSIIMEVNEYIIVKRQLSSSRNKIKNVNMNIIVLLFVRASLSPLITLSRFPAGNVRLVLFLHISSGSAQGHVDLRTRRHRSSEGRIFSLPPPIF